MRVVGVQGAFGTGGCTCMFVRSLKKHRMPVHERRNDG